MNLSAKLNIGGPAASNFDPGLFLEGADFTNFCSGSEQAASLAPQASAGCSAMTLGPSATPGQGSYAIFARVQFNLPGNAQFPNILDEVAVSVYVTYGESCTGGSSLRQPGAAVGHIAPRDCPVSPPAAISLDVTLPEDGENLLAVAPKTSPFFGAGQYTYSQPAEVYLQLTDDSGNVLAQANPQTVPAGANLAWGKTRPFVFIPAINTPTYTIPNGAFASTVLGNLHLQAILENKATLKPVAMSNIVDYPVVVGAIVQAQLGWWTISRPSSAIKPTILPPPTVGSDSILAVWVLDSAGIQYGYNYANPTAPQKDGGVVLTVDFAGKSATMDVLVSVSNRGQVNQIGSLSVTDLNNTVTTGPGQQLLFSNGPAVPMGDFLLLTPQLTTTSGQQVLFPAIQLPIQYIDITSIAHAPPCTNARGECLWIGQTNHFQASLAALATKSGAAVVRGADTIIPFAPTAGTPSTYTDTFDLNLSQDASPSVFYSLLFGDSAEAEAKAVAYHNLQQAIVVSSGATTQVPLPSASLNNVTSSAPQTEQASNSSDNATFIRGLLRGVKELKPDTAHPALPAAAAGTAGGTPINLGFLGLNRTWNFSPAIPGGGNFVSDLTLNYAPSDFPDDPNFVESQLKMISYDPSSDQFFSYPTTVDTVNHAATAHQDGLAAWYSLAVLPPFSQSYLNFPVAPTNFVLTNTGPSSASVNLNGFAEDGTLISQNTPNIAAGAQYQGFPSAWLQAASASPGLAGAAWLDNGLQYEVLPMAPATGHSLVFTTVEHSSLSSTEIHLGNLTNAQRTANLALQANDGTVIDTYTEQIPAKGALIHRVEEMFPHVPASFSGYVLAGADGPVAGSALIISNTTVAAIGAQVTDAPAPVTHYSAPQLGGATRSTVLSVVNTGSVNANLTLRAYAKSGTAAGSATPLQVPAGQPVSQDITTLLSIDPTTIGSFTVDSDQPGVFGDISISSLDFANTLRMSVPLTAAPLESSVFPLATGAATASFANLNSSPANVTLTFRAADGSVAGTGQLSIPAFASSGGAVASMISGLSASASGSLFVQSNQPFTASLEIDAASGEGGEYLAMPSGASAPGGGGTPPAQVSISSVSNAATAKTTLARGEVASIQGSNFTSSSSAAFQSPSTPVRNLGNVSVTVGGASAPLYFVSSTQIDFQVPFEVPAGSSANLVVTANNSASPAMPVSLADYALGVFSYPRTAIALDPIVVHLNGSLVTPANSAAPGETVIVYATGIGKLTNAPATGAAAGSSPKATAVDLPTVTVGTSAAKVVFAGLAPGSVGLAQIQITLPATLSAGSVPIAIQFPGDSAASLNLAIGNGNTQATPNLTFSTNSLSFGNVTVGQTEDLAFTVNNTGSAALNISSILSSNAIFHVISPSVPFSVQPGDSTAVTLAFSPASPGTQSGTLLVASNDPAQPTASVSLSGSSASTLGDTRTGLAGWWKFDEGSGTLAMDSSGNGNTGTLTGGATWTAGQFAGALKFDGVTGYVQGSGPGTGFPRGSAARTISAWVNVTSPQSADNAILHYGTGSGTPAAANLHLYMTGSPAGHIGFGNGYGFGVIQSARSVADGNWHLVVGVYDGDASVGGDGLAHIYVDNALDTTGTLTTTPNTGSVSNWRIGQFIASGTPFRGALDDVRIYDRALSLADVQALYAGQ